MAAASYGGQAADRRAGVRSMVGALRRLLPRRPAMPGAVGDAPSGAVLLAVHIHVLLNRVVSCAGIFADSGNVDDLLD